MESTENMNHSIAYSSANQQNLLISGKERFYREDNPLSSIIWFKFDSYILRRQYKRRLLVGSKLRALIDLSK